MSQTPANPHYVSTEPYNPEQTAQTLTKAQKRYYTASQWQLIFWRFKKHKLAYWSSWILLLSYLSIFFCGFLSPYGLHERNIDSIYSPPQPVHFFKEGKWVGPFVYGWEHKLNMNTLERVYSEDKSQYYPIEFFCKGNSYQWLGLVATDRHFVCPAKGGTLFLLGTDRLGRDMLSRIVYGARISLTIGLISICLSMFFGILIGSLAGFYGGIIDHVVQRVIEVIRSFPELPLWMALSAILPVSWSPVWIFFGLTIILAMLDWTGLARAVRSKLLALREEDYVLAAKLMGASNNHLIYKQLLPGLSSHLIASASLSIPAMILGETALSFLGLGLKAPITSWGVLLSEAQNINAVAIYPWLMLPVIPVIIVILCFNFLGDGLRDALDPYYN